MHSSVAHILETPSQKHPLKTAIVFINTEETSPYPRVEISYEKLLQNIQCASCTLQKQGIKKGDAVGLMAENSIAFIHTWFAIQSLGAYAVPIPILSALPEVLFRLQKTNATCLIVDHARNLIAQKVHEQIEISILNIHTLHQEESSHTKKLKTVNISPQDPSMVLFTSGTTGEPKGAVITHQTLIQHTKALVEHTLGLEEADRILTVLPLTHSYGLRMAMLAPLMAGSTLVVLPRFRAEKSLEILSQEKITWLPAVPTMYNAWRNCDLENLAQLSFHIKWCLSAGAPIPQDAVEQTQNILGAEIRQGYGLTEATFSTINAPPDKAIPTSVGKPVPGVKLRIMNERKQPLPPMKEGRVYIQGMNVMKEYLHDKTSTDKTIQDGWLDTGDLGYVDEEGRLFVVDRLKDLILRGGNNVYPSEVEKVLMKHPDIHDVAVIGEPDAYYGENVVAVICRAHRSSCTEKEKLMGEIDTLCREQLAPYKVPRKVAFVDQLPLGPSNKVLKRTLRQMLEKGEIQTQKVP